MEKIIEAMKILDRLSIIGSRLAVSDVGAGIQLCKAALNGASLNVFINTKMMKDRARADELDTRTDELLIEGNELADKIYDTVVEAIR
jgi:formiminotetrahydrofolate cyclodeaminase